MPQNIQEIVKTRGIFKFCVGEELFRRSGDACDRAYQSLCQKKILFGLRRSGREESDSKERETEVLPLLVI